MRHSSSRFCSSSHSPLFRTGSCSQRGQAQLIASGLLLGTLGVFVQEAGQHPVTTVWFRCAFGALALLVCGACAGWLRQLRLSPTALGLTLMSTLLMLLNWALFFSAIPRLSLGLATVVFHVQPLWMLGLGAWLLREPVRLTQYCAALVALFGLVLATGVSSTALLDADRLLGLLMCLGAAMSYALVVVLARLAAPRVTPYAMATWQCLIGSVALAFWPLTHGWPSWGATWLWLAGLGVLHTGLAYALLYAGMARIPAARAALLQFVYPAAALGVDWWMYGHALGPLQMAGVLLMGLALGAMRERAR